MNLGKPIIIIKIGGSTLGSGDTTIEDLVELQRRGIPVVVVHGGGNLITEWLSNLGISTSFKKGLRVTDAETLKVVVAVLCGLVNKELVASIESAGGRAMGMSGIDGGLIEARVKDAELGYVGEIVKINPQPLEMVLEGGYIPVIAPLGLGRDEAMPLNVNADTAAGDIAAAIGAWRLIFLTDVEGILDKDGEVLKRLSPDEVRHLIRSETISTGMIPKVEACLCALSSVSETRIIDGRVPHALTREIDGKGEGTTIA